MSRLRRHRQEATCRSWFAQLGRLGWDLIGWQPWSGARAQGVRLRSMRRAQERLLRPRGAIPGLRPDRASTRALLPWIE